MNSYIEESNDQINKNPFERCINLIEKIISSLNDQEIVERYFQMKSKILNNNKNGNEEINLEYDTDKAYLFFQSLSEENQKLKNEYENLKLQKPKFNDSSDNLIISTKLHELQQKILPTYSLGEKKDSLFELESLKKVINAKLESLLYLRNNLKEENIKLKKQYKEISNNLNQKLEIIKEKEENQKIEFKNEEENFLNLIKESDNKLKILNNEYENLINENQNLLKNNSETILILDNIKKDTLNNENKIEEIENESENLFNEIEQLKLQISIKSKELESLKTLQKFGIDVSNNFNIKDEIIKLKEKSEFLKLENSQLSFELKRLDKKLKNSNTIIDSNSIISLNEDELAAQIFKNKWN